MMTQAFNNTTAPAVTLATAYRAARKPLTPGRTQTPAAALADARARLSDFLEARDYYETCAAVRDIHRANADSATLLAAESREAARQARAEARHRPELAVRARVAAKTAEGDRKAAQAALREYRDARRRFEAARRRLSTARLRALIPHHLQPQQNRAVLGHGSIVRARDAKGRRRTFVVAVMPDSDMGAPWKEHDGHGVVSELTGRAKRPGEVVLHQDRRGARYYDWQESCKRARDEAWGGLPGPLFTRVLPGAPYSTRGGVAWCPTAGVWAYDPDSINKAVRAVFDLAQARMTPRQQAVNAVKQDFERMQDWIRDEWCWVGVGLIELPPEGTGSSGESIADRYACPGLGHRTVGRLAESLWGIESYMGDYLDEVVNDLLAQACAA